MHKHLNMVVRHVLYSGVTLSIHKDSTLIVVFASHTFQTIHHRRKNSSKHTQLKTWQMAVTDSFMFHCTLSSRLNKTCTHNHVSPFQSVFACTLLVSFLGQVLSQDTDKFLTLLHNSFCNSNDMQCKEM